MMGYTYIDSSQFEVVADEDYLARPVCPKCKKSMQFIDAHYTSYGDAAYWECDRNSLDCPHDDIVIVWHSDVQDKLIQQLETEVTALRQQVAALQAALADAELPKVETWIEFDGAGYPHKKWSSAAAGTVAKNATVEGSGTNAE